jgi:hypothetical protein
MTFGRNHPASETTEIQITVEPGGGWIVLTPDEFWQLVSGEAVEKRSGDANGAFILRTQLVRTSRDPKVDPQPGDILEKDGFRRQVTSRRGSNVLWCRTLLHETRLCFISTWVKWAKTATVVCRGTP